MTEKKVYTAWIPLINPELQVVDFLHQVDHNKVYIVSGEGTPNLFGRIAPSVKDIVAHGDFDRFVISVDAEDMDAADKLAELMVHVNYAKSPVPVHTIVQNYCFESWALGNRVIGSKRPQDTELIELKRAYDVARLDPALMPSYRTRFNRSQFSELYLRRLLNDQRKGLTYSKANPSVVCHHKYFEQVIKRHSETGHVASVSQLISAFT